MKLTFKIISQHNLGDHEKRRTVEHWSERIWHTVKTAIFNNNEELLHNPYFLITDYLQALINSRMRTWQHILLCSIACFVLTLPLHWMFGFPSALMLPVAMAIFAFAPEKAQRGSTALILFIVLAVSQKYRAVLACDQNSLDIFAEGVYLRLSQALMELGRIDPNGVFIFCPYHALRDEIERLIVLAQKDCSILDKLEIACRETHRLKRQVRLQEDEPFYAEF